MTKQSGRARSRRTTDGVVGRVLRWCKRDWTKREKVITALSGLGLLVIAGVPAAYNLYEWAASSAKITAAPPSALSMSYDPRSKAITFSFGAGFHNEGTRDERISNVSAYLRVHDDKKRQYQFERHYITLKDVSGQTFVIAKGTEKTVTYEISAHLIREFTAVLTDAETRRQLEVIFKGRDGSYPMTFNFDLSKEASAMLLANQLPKGLRFVEESWK